MSEAGAAQVEAEALTPKHGGKEETQRRFEPGKEWRGIGVVYVRTKDGVIEISILYESHVPQAVKEELASRFGVGVYEWRVTGK